MHLPPSTEDVGGSSAPSPAGSWLHTIAGLRSPAGEALLAAEGSDWFWWYGDDQDSGRDAEFDVLFRRHVASVYVLAGAAPPAEVSTALVAPTVVWRFTHRIASIRAGARLVIRTNCPGTLCWATRDGPRSEAPLLAIGGVMVGARRYQRAIGPCAAGERVQLRFECAHPGCDGHGPCCDRRDEIVDVL